jgi:galactose mutarotase-like enzyme
VLQLENEFLKVEIQTLGAELTRIYHKKSRFDYLWNGDPDFWPRRAPILFPIVGKLKGNNMIFNHQHYQIMQHGFARDMKFELNAISNRAASFLLLSNDVTKSMYPFEWKLQNNYEIHNNILSVTTEVTNTSTLHDMFFSIGYHPAFRLPLSEGLEMEDFILEFNRDISAPKWLLVDGLIGSCGDICIENGTIQLTKSTFLQDALVFKGLKSNQLVLRSAKSRWKLIFNFEGFPYLGLWSKPNAHFVCIEPWHGCADHISHNGDLTTKEGIKCLKPQQTFKCGYQVEFS